MSNCPNCNKPVDTLRSRHVSVRDGKIVAYCSPECLAAAATQPVRAVPKSAPQLDSEPVIQILHEPASGVVTSAPDQRKSAPVAVQTPPPDDKVEPKPEDKPKTKAERKAAEKAERAKKQSDAIKPLPKPAEPSKPTAQIVEDDAKPVSAAALAEAEAKPKPRNRRDSSDAKGAWEWLDDEPAEPVSPRRRRDADEEGAPKKGSRGLQAVLVIGILALLGVGGYFAYDRYLKQRAEAPPPADAAVSFAKDVVAVDPDAGLPREDPAQIRDRALKNALTVLRKTLETSSPQMQEKAALSLARAKDEKAIAYLADALPRSSTDTKRLEIAYALARASDKRGIDALLAATKVASRDTRLDAGKKLAQLGDKSAIAPLSPFIDTRFEVAKALAPLGEPRAIKELELMRKEGKGDEKTRATIALVAAGKPEHLAEVQALLKDRSFRHDASLALAERKDGAARPILLENFKVQSTQPEVARALRLVEPSADLTPQLVELEQGLLSEKDTEQIKAADAILMLAGPEEWVARP